MPFTATLPPVHPLHGEAIREALDDLVELTGKPPRSAPSYLNREPCVIEDLPPRIRVALDPAWSLLTETERSSHVTFPCPYVECVEVALRRLVRALRGANLVSIVEHEKAWEDDRLDAPARAAERVARTLLLAAVNGSPVEHVLAYPISAEQVGRETWAHPEYFRAVALAFADFREVMLGRLSSDVHGGRLRTRPRLSIEGLGVLLDGRPVPLDMTSGRRDEALAYLRHLLEAAGDWRSDSEVDRAESQRPGGLVVSRWDKVRKSLPGCIGDLVETNRRKGSRLKAEAYLRE